MPKRAKHPELFLSNRKEQFIEEQVSSDNMKALFRNLFEYVAEDEHKKQKDVSTWDEEEMRELLQKLAGFRSYSSENRANLLKRYINWCRDKRIPGVSDVISSIQIDTSQKIKERLVSDPAHLQRCLDSFLTPEEDLTIDNILRGYCWLAYMGLSEAEIAGITKSQVSLDYGIVTVSGSSFPFPDEAFACLKSLMGDSFCLYHDGYGGKCTSLDRAQGNRLLRGFRNPEISIANLRSVLSNKAKRGNADLRLSYSRIWLSGEFYRMYQKEQKGEPVDFTHLGERAILIREKAGNPYKLVSENGKRTENGKMRELAREYEEDYKRWKEAYHAEK